MAEKDENRPNPDQLLESIQTEEAGKSGKLKIFFGYAAGVGKTYAMLDAALEQFRGGQNVLVGYVEPHTRPDTMQLLDGLPVLPPRIVPYRNLNLREFDLDAALARKPRIIIVDELAHTNAEGVRNRKRYQDVEELLGAGIDVYTTMNVQHLESLNDVVQNITQITVRETIPDSVFDLADQVELIDIEPDELLKRFREGKVYRPERATAAMDHFFTRENLRLLREIAMRRATDRLSHSNESERRLTGKMASSRLLVCIGPAPSCAKCIRWTARTAEAFHAPWVAVYVENIESQFISEKDKGGIRENISLAERLGAEVVTLNGDNVASAVAEYARMSGITNIVIGKSRNRKTILNLFRPNLEDELIALVPGIEVHIIPSLPAPGKSYNQPKMKLLRKNLFLSGQDILKTVALLVLATLVSSLLQQAGIGSQNIIMIYILAVLIVSRITMGYLYGILSSILSVLIFNFFFIEPYYTFLAIQPGYPITFLIMLLAALITSALTVRIKTQVRLSAVRERRTEILNEISKKLLSTRDLDKTIELVNSYITKLFERSVILYINDPADSERGIVAQSPADPDATFLLSDDERAVAHWVYVNQKNAGAGTDTLMGAGALYLPIIAQGNSLGVIGLSCARGKFNQTNYSFLRMIISLVALALARQALSDEQHKVQIESEKEKMRGNLLRAISHDLRTPLTGIYGASSTILESGSQLDKPTQEKLIRSMRDEAQWLIRLVENLLSVTRIDEETLDVQKSVEAAEEIVAEVVSRTRKRFPERQITVQVPDDVLLVPMDGTLIEQVLLNLLDNAVHHSPADSRIEVGVRKLDCQAEFRVTDQGTGIAEEDLPHIFDSFNHLRKHTADAARGMGIGLSICLSIIKAHHGSLTAENNPAGGATFRFLLPLEEKGKHE